MKQTLFWCAGFALGRVEVGEPADVSLRSVPKMNHKTAAKVLKAAAP
jgi:hypothetical protein